MKKIKFFNGISATFALAAVALATTFTSCEKEDFNVNFEQSPAKVIFSPNVIDAASSVNVTDQATFTGADPIVSTASDKSLGAGEVTITATVNGVTGEIKVKYPAVAAGQIVSISPVIMLSSEFDFVAVDGSVKPVGPVSKKYGNAPEGGIDHAGFTWAKNDSEFLINFTASWDETVTVTRKDAETKATVNAPYEYKVNQKGSVKLYAGAWSLYNALFEIQAANIAYKVISKASGESTIVVYHNPSYVLTASTTEMAIPGHEHAFQHGHGHGDGSNAGGGISLAD